MHKILRAVQSRRRDDHHERIRLLHQIKVRAVGELRDEDGQPRAIAARAHLVGSIARETIGALRAAEAAITTAEPPRGLAGVERPSVFERGRGVHDVLLPYR